MDTPIATNPTQTDESALEQIGENIWTIDYDFKLLGAEFGNRMTIIRYEDNKLLLHSPIPFTPTLKRVIDTLGTVTLLMAPNLMHNLFINDWKKEYASATLIAPKNIKKVEFDITLEDISNSVVDIFPTQAIQLQFIAGMKGINEYALIHKESRTLILTDLAFNIQKTPGIWSTLFFRLYGAYGKFGPTFLIKSIIKNKEKFSQSIDAILTQEFDKIIISHGETVKSGGREIFINAFSHIKQ